MLVYQRVDLDELLRTSLGRPINMMILVGLHLFPNGVIIIESPLNHH